MSHASPAFQVDSLPLSHLGSLLYYSFLIYVGMRECDASRYIFLHKSALAIQSFVRYKNLRIFFLVVIPIKNAIRLFNTDFILSISHFAYICVCYIISFISVLLFSVLKCFPF